MTTDGNDLVTVLTKREYFAAQAMQAHITACNSSAEVCKVYLKTANENKTDLAIFISEISVEGADFLIKQLNASKEAKGEENGNGS